MGLIIDVYRDSGADCTNGGISGQHDRLTLVNASGPFDPKDDRPAVMLIQGPSVGEEPNPIIVPARLTDNEWQPIPGQFASGGNYGATSDSRFSAAVVELGGTSGSAIRIHDRRITN